MTPSNVFDQGRAVALALLIGARDQTPDQVIEEGDEGDNLAVFFHDPGLGDRQQLAADDGLLRSPELLGKELLSGDRGGEPNTDDDICIGGKERTNHGGRPYHRIPMTGLEAARARSFRA